MIIDGNLSEHTTIKGVISDRAYDKGYGYSNSRINELEKVQLEIMSPSFSMRIGDIYRIDNSKSQSFHKKLIGINTSVNSSNYYINATAARPKGEFQTKSFTGQNNNQGPYQITSQNNFMAIVSGSEKVWLDGELLTRGADHDYIIDYPLGQITFTINRMITSRSRIEVDYEPFSDQFKREYYASESGLNFFDSTLHFKFGWEREGDLKEYISESFNDDDRQFLQSIGDSTNSAIRSSVTPDTLGAYILLVDSLPDSIYRYVGEGEGNYKITFSYLGQNRGDYRFLGSNHYQYTGKNQGEYLPVVFIPIPKRYDHFNSSLSYNNQTIGLLELNLFNSNSDNNLFSNLDDSDNAGTRYNISLSQNNSYSLKYQFLYEYTDHKYFTKIRQLTPDYQYKMMFPQLYIIDDNQEKLLLNTVCRPFGSLQLNTSYNQFKQTDKFKSDRITSGLVYEPIRKVEIGGEYSHLETRLNGTQMGGGDESRLSMTLSPANFNLSNSFHFSKRTNDYSGTLSGTRLAVFNSLISYKTASLEYNYFNEDSLIDDSWSADIKRHTTTFKLIFKLKSLSVSNSSSYQSTKEKGFESDHLLQRLSLNYQNWSRKITINNHYTLSQQQRNSYGISYYEVEEGEGDFILEDSVYISDPNGNYIKVEEVLSDRSSVKHAEKNFNLSKQWSKITFNLKSNIKEDLLADQNRNYRWLLPFYFDSGKNYLFAQRQSSISSHLFPVTGGYIINLSLNHFAEQRAIGGNAKSREQYDYELTLRENYRNLIFQQSLNFFSITKDNYYTGGGDVDGFNVSSSFMPRTHSSRYKFTINYRFAQSDDRQNRARRISLKLDSDINMNSSLKFKPAVELYSQKTDGDNINYALVGTHYGTKGIFWSLMMKHQLKSDLKINMNVYARHSDNHRSRITAKFEMIASF